MSYLGNSFGGEYYGEHYRGHYPSTITAIVTPPYAEAVTVTEMKNHLKQESSVTEDDALIGSQTTAARDCIETGTGSNVQCQRTMLATTFSYRVHDWCQLENVRLPRIPVVNIDSVAYIDVGGTSQTLGTDIYELKGDYLCLKRLQIWPSHDSVPFPITVQFKAGIVASFSRTSGDTMTVSGRTFATGDQVQVMNSGGALPTGLAALTTYYVINASGATFKLSLTSGGTAVALSADGTGTNYIGTDMVAFETLRNAMKLLVGGWYRNRESVVLDLQPYVMPLGVDALIQSQHA